VKPRDVNVDGLTVKSLLKVLKRATKSRKWRAIAHQVPIPFRHFRPAASPSILLIGKLTPNGTSYVHFIAFDGHFLHDPDIERRISLAQARADRRWRSWFVAAEVIHG